MQADREEAQYRAEQRRIQIERANKILFDESDRVRNFHSTMLLSDVIKQNEALVAFKRQIEQLEKEAEAKFVKDQAKALAAKDQATLKALGEARAKRLQQKEDQLAQLEDLKQRILAERAERKAEGQVLAQKAKMEEEALAAKEAAARARSQQFLEETKHANDVLLEYRRLERERDAAAMAAIEAYATKKGLLQEERDRREAERKAAKEAERKRLVDIMEKNFMEAKSKEASRWV